MGFVQELFEINVLIIDFINSENYEIDSVMMWTYLELIQILWYGIIYEFVIVKSWVITVSYEY